MKNIRALSRKALIVAAQLTIVASCGGHDSAVGATQQAVSDDAPLAVPPDTVVPPDVSRSNHVVDSLPGYSNVTADGQSHYIIPLWAPPGRAGMQPDLSLEYASRTGNGLLGVGWSLTGFSQIVRCPHTYAVFGGQTITQPGPVKFDASDDFCMDGQHLRMTATMRDGSTVYHTERDNFASVVAHPGTNGPQSVTVYEKNGRIDDYTGYSLGRAFYHDSQWFPVLTAWLITRSSDRYGNTITFSYQGAGNDPSAPVTNYAYPSMIEYTGSTTTPGLSANRFVAFSYEARSDWEESYAAGQTQLGQRMSRIFVSGPGAQRTYQLSYVPDGSASVTGRSLLQSVTMGDGAGHDVQSTNFEWELGATGFTRSPTTVTDYAASEKLKGFELVDINRDGFADLLYVVHDNSGHPEYAVRLWKEGLSDFGPLNELHLKPTKDYWGNYTFPRAALEDSNTVGLLMWGKPGNVFNVVPFVQEILTKPDGSLWLPGYSDFDRTADVVFPADFDGDGLADIIVGFTKNGPPIFEWYRNMTSTTLAFGPATPILVPSGTAFPGHTSPAPMRGMNFDGDTRQSVVICYDSANGIPSPSVVGLDTQMAPWSLPYSWALCDPGYSAQYVDFNGDGLDDLLVPYRKGPEVDIAIGPGPTGSGYNPNLAYPLTYPDDGKATALVIDYDLDGHPDILSSKPDSSAIVSVYKFNGTQIGDYAPFPQQDPGIQIGAQNALAVGDVTGDGLDDLISLESGRFVVYARNGKKPDLLTRVVDGFGAETRFTYQPISNSVVYDSSSSLSYSYPLRPVTGGLWVVSEHDVANGIKQQPTQYFHKYAQGVDDIQDHGFLGFGYHEVDWYDALPAPLLRSRKEWYDNTTRTYATEPYVGKPTKVDTLTYGSGGVVVHEEIVNKSYETLLTNNNSFPIYFPYPGTTQYTELDAGSGGNLIETKTQTAAIDAIDSYGNVLSSSFDNGAGEFQKTENTYDNSRPDPTIWLVTQLVKCVESSTIKLPPPLHGKSQTRTVAYKYDGHGSVEWQVTEPDYDANGQIVPLAQPQSDGVQSQFTHYVRDTDGQVRNITIDGDFTASATQRTETIFRDGDDRVFPTRVTNKLGQTVRLAIHGGLGVLAATVDENGQYSRWQYDTLGRLKRSEASGGESLSFGYLGYFSNVASVDPTKAALSIHENGDASDSKVTQFDVLRRPVSETQLNRNDGAFVVSDLAYDQFGRVVSATRPYFQGSLKAVDHFVYDSAGRLHRRELADGRVEEFDYYGTPSGLAVDHYDAELTDSTVLRSTKHMDLAGRLSSSVEHAAAKDGRSARDVTVSYGYGPFGTVDSINSSGTWTSRSHDRVGRQIYLSDPSHGRRWDTYNVFGELETETVSNASGSPAEIRVSHYDDLGRVATLTTRDGTTRWNWDTSPHGIGKLGWTVSSTGIRTDFGYDSLSRPTEESYTIGSHIFTVTQVIDGFGRLGQLKYPTVNGSRFIVDYNYGPHGALQKITDDSTGHPFWTASDVDVGGVPVNPSGAFPQFALGNGVDVHFNENPHRPGFLVSIQSRSSSGSLVQSLAYQFDSKGYLWTRGDDLSGLKEAFDYDELNRLEHWTVGSSGGGSRVRYDYTDLGNLTARSYESGAGSNATYDYKQERGAGPYAVSATGAKLFSYDAEGNLSQAGSRKMSFSAFGLPLTMSDAGTAYEFHYDAFQRRVEKKETASGVVDDTVSIGQLYKRESVSNGAANHVYTVVAPTGPVAQVTATDGNSNTLTFYILQDHLGSADTILKEGASGTYETRKFDPFGNRFDPSNPLGTVPARISPVTFGFAGHEHDWDLGLINMSGRIFDPTTGRFASPDPFVESPFTAGGLNSYSYVLNRPSTLTDPTGFGSCDGNDCGTAGQPPTLPPIYGNPGSGTSFGDPGAHYPCSGCGSAKGGQSSQRHTSVDPEAAQAAYSAQDRQFLEIPSPAPRKWGLTLDEWSRQAHRYDGPFGPLVLLGDAARAFDDLVGHENMAALATVPVIGFAVDGAVALEELDGLEALYVAAPEGAEALRFSQTTASEVFSNEGTFAGKTIGSLAGELRAGKKLASEVPVRYVTIEGSNLIVDTRSSLALTRAGIPQSAWTLIDATVTDAASIQQRLLRNGISVEGTPVLRITGSTRDASSLR